MRQIKMAFRQSLQQYTYPAASQTVNLLYHKSNAYKPCSYFNRWLVLDLEPLLLTKREYYDEGIFELSWKRDGRGSPKSPTDHDQLIYYTLFWCEHVMDRPYICNVGILFVGTLY